jgi:hypothetical protein
MWQFIRSFSKVRLGDVDNLTLLLLPLSTRQFVTFFRKTVDTVFQSEIHAENFQSTCTAQDVDRVVVIIYISNYLTLKLYTSGLLS